MRDLRRLQSSLLSSRNNFDRGIRILVNGALNDAKPLKPHVAEKAVDHVEIYITQLERLIAELLTAVNVNKEIEH
jgi:hypothetical protein